MRNTLADKQIKDLLIKTGSNDGDEAYRALCEMCMSFRLPMIERISSRGCKRYVNGICKQPKTLKCSVDWPSKYSRDGRWDTIARAIELLGESLTKKIIDCNATEFYNLQMFPFVSLDSGRVGFRIMCEISELKDIQSVRI